jgi:hypothetical protein
MGWRKFHKLHNFYSLPDIIRMIKSKRIRWTGHVAHKEEGQCIQGFGGKDCQEET